MFAGLSVGTITTSLFVAKSVRSETPGVSSTVSIAVPLADANTSAVPSLPIWVARSVEEPKLNVTCTPALAASKSFPIWVKAAVSDEAAKTVSSELPDAEAPAEVVVVDDEQAASRTTTTAIANRRTFRTSPMYVGRTIQGYLGIKCREPRVEKWPDGRCPSHATGVPSPVMDVAHRVRAPGGVRFAAWMIGINAFFLCLGGVLLLFVRPDPATAQEGLTRGVFQVIGFMLLAIGLIEFLLIYALVDGSNVARIVVTVLIGINVAGSLLQVLGHSANGVVAWLQLLLDAVILVCLWGTPNASEFFRRDPDRTSVAPPPPVVPPPPPRL